MVNVELQDVGHPLKLKFIKDKESNYVRFLLMNSLYEPQHGDYRIRVTSLGSLGENARGPNLYIQ